MLITIKNSEGKKIKVDVSRAECKDFQCLSPHRYTHTGQTIDNKNNDWQDKEFSCSHRNYHGCPDFPKLKKE